MSAQQNLLDALEMWQDGVEMMRSNLRRRHPNASSEDVETMLAEWLSGPTIEEPDRVVLSAIRRRR